MPLNLWGDLGIRGCAGECRLRLLRRISRLNPLVRTSIVDARLILVQNRETLSSLPASARRRARVRPHASVSSIEGSNGTPEGNPTVLFAGRLVAWKGGKMALRALRRLPCWRMIVVGQGPQQRSLRVLARRWGLETRVHFIPWVEQPYLWNLIRQSSVVLLPSLRDDSPFVVAEALAAGTPVVLFGTAALPTGST